MMTDRMRKEINTSCVLPCNSGHVGQLTLYLNSWYDSLKNDLNLFILQFSFSARVERLELPAYGFGDRHSTN